MHERLGKSLLLFLLAVFLVGSTAAQEDILVEGFTEEKIKTTFYDTPSNEQGEVNFQTEYLDLNLTYKQVFTHPDFADQFLMLQFQKNTVERTDTADTIRFRPTLRSDQNADYGHEGLNQVFAGNGEWYYDQETTIIIGEQVGEEFSGTLEHSNGDLSIDVSSHNEHLILNYTVTNSTDHLVWTGEQRRYSIVKS